MAEKKNLTFEVKLIAKIRKTMEIYDNDLADNLTGEHPFDFKASIFFAK